jgi:hypothetical protein
MVRTYSYKRNKPRSAQESPTPFRFAPAVQPILVTRNNQKAVEPDFPDRFKAAIQTMISQGNYSRLVDIHADMDHRMHSMNGPVGTRRFLPWHRIYLYRVACIGATPRYFAVYEVSSQAAFGVLPGGADRPRRETRDRTQQRHGTGRASEVIQ